MRIVPFALPDIHNDDIRAVTNVLESLWLTTGKQCQLFEEQFAQVIGSPYAVAVNSATAALHLALLALGIGPGDQVIVPTLTFTATASTVLFVGATPILVDVRAHDHQIDPNCVEKAITEKTKAIVVVHFGGSAAPMTDIQAIAKKHGLYVIADAAHALPCSFKGQNVGALADISCFSFYATKTMTTGEGGMAVTANRDWAQSIRLLSLHGLSKDAWNRHGPTSHHFYDVLALGYKYNMTDMSAALGLSQLSRLQAMHEKRLVIAKIYDKFFTQQTLFDTRTLPTEDTHSYHLYVIRLNANQNKLHRDQVIERLKEQGIVTSVHFVPLHMHSLYRARFHFKADDFVVAHDIYKRSLSLPIYSRMNEEDAFAVCAALECLFC